jgi:hypothetical protein
MNINPENPVNILIFNFNEEENNYNDNYFFKQFVYVINKKKPNIIVICTQNSISRTDKHLQHIIGDKLPENYKRFSKVDATRQSDLKKIVYKNLKNVRMRIYYNTETVYVNNVFNRFSKQSSKKRSIFNFSNNSIDENEEKYSGSNTNNKQIIIKEYKYRRYTVEGENGRTGKGGIMTSIVFRMNGLEEYKYIVCNYNFNSENIQSNFNKIIKNGNIKLDSINLNNKLMKIQNPLQESLLDQKKLQENLSLVNRQILFIYFVSQNKIQYGKYFNISNKNIIKLNKNKNKNSLPPNEYFPKNKFLITPEIISDIESLYKNKVFEYMFSTVSNKNIKNIGKNIIQDAIIKAIENKNILNKKELIPILDISHKNLNNILISCPVCNYSFYLEKACGVTRCCNSNNNQLNKEELCNKISNEDLQHCSKEECNILKKTYPNACLTPLVILTIDYQEHKDINVCLSTLPYYF